MGFVIRVDHDATVPEFPEGEYVVTVAKVEMRKKSEDAKGESFGIDFLVTAFPQPEYVGRKIPEYIMSLHENSKWKLAQFFDAIGLSGKGVVDHNSDDLVGRSLKIRGATRPWEGKDKISRKRFEVDLFMNIAGPASAPVPHSGSVTPAPIPVRATVAV